MECDEKIPEKKKGKGTSRRSYYTDTLLLCVIFISQESSCSTRKQPAITSNTYINLSAHLLPDSGGLQDSCVAKLKENLVCLEHIWTLHVIGSDAPAKDR